MNMRNEMKVSRVSTQLATILLFLLLVTPDTSYGEKPMPLRIPKQTAFQGCVLDKTGVIQCHYKDTRGGHNIFEVAMQARRGSEYLQGLGVLTNIRKQEKSGELDQYQLTALAWLEQNAAKPDDDTLIWYHTYPNVYNDVEIKPPWASAFGQAHVLQAFLYAYQVTRDEKYRALARKTGKAFGKDIQSGGLHVRLPDGSLFFEELPILPATHILNGHMISTISLLEVGAALNFPELVALGKAGVEALRHHLHKYDLGYWSRYDMNPKKGEIFFRLRPESAASEQAMLIDRITLMEEGQKYSTELDIGAPDDGRGAWRITGTDWTQPQQIEGRTVRGLMYGPGLRNHPAVGGTIQNTYVVMQLPRIQFEELSEVPTYYLKLVYYDNGPSIVNVEIRDINHGNFLGFRALSHGSIYTVGDKRWHEVIVPVKPQELAWFMGHEYQRYHVKLLRQLAQLTADQFFEAYADRWELYLNNYSEKNEEEMWAASRLKILEPKGRP
ncbi:MAG: hypothetical protein HYY11_06380 [Candidatus Methylomirabilis oxyfera]|nr:hypothetical protein [Candidatus Methylomirabilis oxyfera]